MSLYICPIKIKQTNKIMKNSEKVQRAKVGVAGSFFNQLMSNNSTLPEVGKGATQMMYSDRYCFEVKEVSEDGKRVILESLDARADLSKPCPMGHQNWILEPTGQLSEIRWRHGAWRMLVDLNGKPAWNKINIIFGVKRHYRDWSF